MTTTQRRTVAEMEKRLADAREMIENMRDDAIARREQYTAGTDTWSDINGRAFEHGSKCGLDQALTLLTACFDDPTRDWMYQRP